MPAPNPLRQILEEVGYAICATLVRLLDTQGPHGPLRRNSALRQQLLSSEAVQIAQQRGADGRWGNLGLNIVAQDYLQWLDTGRRPGGKKVPIQALLAFIKARGLGQARGKNGRFTGTSAKSLNALAFAIQQAIWLHGVAGRHVIAPAWEAGTQLLSVRLDESALAAMTTSLDLFFTKTGK